MSPINGLLGDLVTIDDSVFAANKKTITASEVQVNSILMACVGVLASPSPTPRSRDPEIRFARGDDPHPAAGPDLLRRAALGQLISCVA